MDVFRNFARRVGYKIIALWFNSSLARLGGHRNLQFDATSGACGPRIRELEGFEDPDTIHCVP